MQELARLFRAYADASELEDIAMKAIVVYQILLLQKPCKSSRSKDHVRHLQRRLTLWQNDYSQRAGAFKAISQITRTARKITLLEYSVI